ncbi:transposase family protein [Pseudanabaenaceae cyanobacterium LEGE 13415]|nr:transposase family protein [Pseudanabaenaceae cyanobacterium LEGE 13415]
MTLIDQLKQIPDPRHCKGRKHPLWMILMLSVLGFLCGYRGYRPLADFCIQHQTELRAVLALPESQALPSYSTFRRTFLQLTPQEWEPVYNNWAAATLPEVAAVLWSIDGKSIRATSTGGNRHAQDFTSLVSVYEQSLGVLH